MKKGFTLVELLAVIVIVAILALVAVPIMGKIIKGSRSSALLNSANLYIKAVELQVMNKNMLEEFYPSECTIKSDGNVICDGEEIIVESKGRRPDGGTLIFEDVNVKEAQLTYEDKMIATNSNGELVYYVPYVESNNIASPDLMNDTLTPVVYDGNNWIVADILEEWYNYGKQEWANAVILDSSVTKKVGDIVTVEGENPDALAMFVWIPRYEYKIEGTYGKGGTSASLPGEIEVNFINLDKTTASQGYIIHPAFTFGETISGIWVGKFETSHTSLSSSTTSNNLNCSAEDCINADNLRILPNVQSLRYNNVSNFFFAARSMSTSGNPFGIDKTETDTHMMKNSEWGAVAYLSQSKYGKYGNSDYTGAEKEVYINNSGGYYTGRSGGSYGGNTAVNTVYTDQTSVTTQNNTFGYYTYDGYLLTYNTNTKSEERNLKKIASTTGNIYGIYDMSGGAQEYVMGVFANSDGALWSGNSSTFNSGFEGKVGSAGDDYEGLEWPNEKYYDVYKASSGIAISSTTACDGGVCFGHALSETASWYGDYALFVSSTYPWFDRGGSSGTGASAGVFGSNSDYGAATLSHTLRVVVSRATVTE